MDDRRMFARFVIEFPMRFLNREENKEGEATTFDVSANGIGVVTSEELQPRNSLEMWFKMPDNSDLLYAKGEVVWSKTMDSNKYKAGIHLERPDLMGISRLLRAGDKPQNIPH